ncbi:hypothetical protein [Candidatus Nitrosocosmicus sp. T]
MGCGSRLNPIIFIESLEKLVWVELIQQGLPLSRTIGIYELPKNIRLTDEFGNNKIPIRAFFSEGLITRLENQV